MDFNKTIKNRKYVRTKNVNKVMEREANECIPMLMCESHKNQT